MVGVRVLMLATDLQRGGLPNRLARLAIELPRHGVEPIAGCLAPRGPLSDELEWAGVTTFACDARGAADPACLARLARAIRRFDPDLIHASLFHANLAARLVGRLDRWRPVLTSTVTIEIERGWHRWLESATSGLSDLHAANSRAVAEHLTADLGFDPRRITVIPNAVDVAALDACPAISLLEQGLEEGVPLLVWAGRMDPVKNLELLLEAVARIRRVRPVQAALLGDGPQRNVLRRKIDDLGLATCVRMPGWQPRPAAWMKAADVFLLPSWTEGAPNALLEAMACGRAAVASDIPACRELISNNINGTLLPPSNSEAWERGVRRLLDDEALRRRLGAAARRSVEQGHRLPDVVQAWVNLYRRLVGRG